MAANEKRRKKHSFGGDFFHFGACFGFSSARKHDKECSAGVGSGLVKYGGRKYSSLGKTFPVSNTIIPSTKEIHVAATETPPPPLPRQVDNKPKAMLIMEKSKQDNITVKAANKLPSSVSLPAALPRQRRRTSAAADAEEYDSLIGAFIIMLILVVMLIWGKMFAILCTAIWFYSVHHLRLAASASAALKSKNDSEQSIDFDSKEYKKRVVLNGFLERLPNL